MAVRKDVTGEKKKRTRAIDPSPGSDDEDDSTPKEFATHYWKMIQDVDTTTISNSKKAFTFSYRVGWLMVILGTFIILVSLYSTVTNPDILWKDTIAGGIGLGVLVANFYKNPQFTLQKALGDFTQIQMYLRSYDLVYILSNYWDEAQKKEKTKKKMYSLEKLEKLTQIIVDNTIKLSTALEAQIGRENGGKNADVKVTDIVIDPLTAESGEEVKVLVTAKNEGAVSGSLLLDVLLDGESTNQEKVVNIRGGETLTIEFKVSSDVAGTHKVKIGEIEKEYTVT